MTERRIVSLIASATEIVCALGFEDCMVGRSHECDFPPSVESLPVCSSSKVDVDGSSRAIDDQVRSIAAALGHPEVFDFGHRGSGWTEWVG